ncbi:hypothetical protein [Dictyobacter formicarum]|uniref:Uncharacterized protein n=1 Tax=Dictyobacter formicarum TaxID=2778368 RepID=A0ABQ3V8T7_9CHLR|nr:hypothetical protein [Dictyobacter formicarum]GHO82535.1 hypothetical protein KSZ_05410 [Dictyobacter formicarum]
MTKDGHLEVDVPAAMVSPQQVQDAGGRIQLKIVQVDAGSGGSLSGRLMLGTYQFSLFDAKGNALTTLVLAQPLTLHYRVSPQQGSSLWKSQTIVAVWNTTATSSPTQAPSTQAPEAECSLFAQFLPV